MDDEQTIREMLSRILRRNDYVVYEAADADAAMDVLRTTCIGVALVDRRMPGRDGDWLVGQLQEQFADIAVVLATGEYVPPHFNVHRGIAGYLSKPFTAEAVRNAVADAAVWHQVASRHKNTP